MFFMGWGRGCGSGAKEREWVAAFDLVSLNSFEQLSETTEMLRVTYTGTGDPIPWEIMRLFWSTRTFEQKENKKIK